jgi:hypothetical protein
MPLFRGLHAVVFGAVAALQLFAASAEAQEKAAIKVGAMLPFTGPAAATGQEKFQGIELAIHRATPDTVCNHWHCHRVDRKQEVTLHVPVKLPLPAKSSVPLPTICIPGDTERES